MLQEKGGEGSVVRKKPAYSSVASRVTVRTEFDSSTCSPSPTSHSGHTQYTLQLRVYICPLEAARAAAEDFVLFD